MSDGTAIEQRDELIVAALEAGQSTRSVQRQFALSLAELDQALERCFPLDTSSRLRMIRGDLSRLDRLIEGLYAKGLAGDVNAATACIRAWERKAALLGLDAVQRIDLQVVSEPKEPAQGYDRVFEAIMRVARGPDWKPDDGDGAVEPNGGGDGTEP